MSTNLDIITDAYRMGNVIPMTTAPDAELGSAGLRRLNDMLASWAADTIDVGWFPQSELTDDAPLDDGVIEAVKSNLAVIFCGVAGMDPPAWVERMAVRTYNTLLRNAVVDALEPADVSDMPVGSASNLNGFDILTG